MNFQSVLEETKVFLEYLGLDEEPFGVYYDDTKPENAFGPKSGIPISREYQKMLKSLPESMFKVGKDWAVVRKKVTRSAKTWGEGD